MTEDEMVGWHHRIDEQEFEQVLGAGQGQGGLACCIAWGCKESDMTEQLNYIISKRQTVTIAFSAKEVNHFWGSHALYYCLKKM